VLVVLSLMLLVFVIAGVSADMSIGQPKSAYNIGDEFSFNVAINSSVNANHFFAAKIVCAGDNSSNEVEIYKIPLSLKSGEQKSVIVDGRFDNFLTGDMGGTCHLNAVYGSDEANTQDFDITRNIYVSLFIDQAIFGPNDRFNVSGKAIKSNGQVADGGFVEMGIAALGINISKLVEAGGFSGMVVIPDDAQQEVTMLVLEFMKKMMRER
jgi:hypothetical protein